MGEIEDMGRPRKPTASHELQGTRPGATNRDRSGEPTADPLGPPSETLDPLQLMCWHEIVGALPKGVALNSDRFTIEIAARLLAKYRAVDLNMKSADLALLRTTLASLGMTPADRSKVGVTSSDGKPKEQDPWDKLANMGGRA
ncbi:MAG: hypothetical protein AAF368_00740 [Planctomycetota bacterium]